MIKDLYLYFPTIFQLEDYFNRVYWGLGSGRSLFRVILLVLDLRH